MKIGCFINCISMPEETISSSGVMKKVFSQIKVLRTEFEIDHVLVNTYGKKQTVSEKVKRRLPFFPVDYNWKYTSQFSGYDFIYFRKSDIDYTVYRFLKGIKKNNPSCKIIFEIPTYPYEKENFHGKKDLPMLWKDRLNHNRFRKCVDRIVTFSDDPTIWNVQTITTKNGVDFSTIPIQQREYDGDAVNLIEVSSPAYWHGYDRVLEGIGRYYQNGGKRNIIFHIVGDGAEVEEYKKIIEKYNIYKHVIFYGNRFGEELHSIYKRAFVGIDSLGRHRSGNSTNSSLKSREYAAYGLPIVSAVPIDFADENWEYAYKVPADDTPLDMEKLIMFMDFVYRGRDCNKVAESIREYALSRCDISVTMRPIVNYLLEN